MQSSIEMQAESDEVVSAAICYLDPDSRRKLSRDSEYENAEAIITLFLLLGGVLLSLVIMFFHVQSW